MLIIAAYRFSIPMVNCSPLRRVKIRTATAGSGSTQQRVLKQNYLQSFKTRRFGFDKDVKTKPLCRTLFKNFL
ncbi:hypothetical protein FUT84_11070 [Treponema phagedenis]|nr:hypothetical protein FUT84_11070 [Treponema phagedenis]